MSSQRRIAFPCLTWRSLWRDQEGSAIVESAVVVPVLMALFAGVYEFSYFFYQQQLITTGVRDAARYLARFDLTSCSSGSMSISNCAVTACVNGSPTNILTAAQNIAIYGYGSSSGHTARVSGWGTSAVTASLADDSNTGASTPCGASACNGGTTSGASSVQVVTVSTTFSDPSLGFFSYLGYGAPNIVISHAERVVGGSVQNSASCS
jgi:Flp pilus assembly protein TadG